MLRPNHRYIEEQRQYSLSELTRIIQQRAFFSAFSRLLPFILEKEVLHFISLGLQVPAVDIIGLDL